MALIDMKSDLSKIWKPSVSKPTGHHSPTDANHSRLDVDGRYTVTNAFANTNVTSYIDSIERKA